MAVVEETLVSARAHSGDVAPGEWWACERPERPPEPSWTIFDLRCRACTISAHVAVRHLDPCRGVDVRVLDDPHGDTPWLVSELAEILAL